MIIQGNIVDILNKHIYKGEVLVENGRIISVTPKDHTKETYILPGFIDAHIHIESSMLVPRNSRNSLYFMVPWRLFLILTKLPMC